MSGPEAAADRLPPLRRDRTVHAWVAASAVSFVGDHVFTIGFAWAAVHAASPAMAGFLVGAHMLPQAVLLLLGGALADRLDTRTVLVSSAAARVVVLVLGALAWQAGAARVPLLLAVGLLFGIADAVHVPAAATLPRQLVRPADLGRVAGAFQVTRRLAVFVGAGIGGWLAASYGLAVAMLADAASFVVVGAVLAVVARPRLPLRRPPVGPVWRDLAAGLGYVRRDRVARRFVVSLSGLNLFVGPALAVGVSLRVAGSGWGAGMLGLVEAIVGVGAAAGALLAMWRSPVRDAWTGFLALVVQGVGIACLGLPERGLVALGAVVVGLTAGSASVLVSGAFQRAVDPTYLGRTSSMTSLADHTLLPVMMPLFGWLSATTTVAATGVLFGAGMVALSGWGAWGFRPGWRRVAAVPDNGVRTVRSTRGSAATWMTETDTRS